MKVSIKKNTIKTIIAIILVIVVITISTIIIKSIIDKKIIEQTEEKIIQINAKELDNKIRAELNKTVLNIDTQDIKTEIIEQVTGYVAFSYKDRNNEKNLLSIPCYRIAIDNNNNFVYIQYIDSRDPIGNIVTETITKILKEDYDINLNGNKKYNSRFTYMYGEMAEVYASNDTFWADVYKKLANQELYNNKKRFYTKAFGVDFEIYKPEKLDIDLDF